MGIKRRGQQQHRKGLFCPKCGRYTVKKIPGAYTVYIRGKKVTLRCTSCGRYYP